VLPKRIDTWSLTSLQQRMVKTGERLLKHALLLLAAVGRESPHVVAVWGHAGKDCDAPITSRIGEP